MPPEQPSPEPPQAPTPSPQEGRRRRVALKVPDDRLWVWYDYDGVIREFEPDECTEEFLDTIFGELTSHRIRVIHGPPFLLPSAAPGEVMEEKLPATTYEWRRDNYACKVCGNVPDEEGCIEHGRGCYTQSADGGGTSYVEFENAPTIPTSGEAMGEKQKSPKTDWDKLRLLAKWLDCEQNNRWSAGDIEVQNDLRRIADQLEKQSTTAIPKADDSELDRINEQLEPREMTAEESDAIRSALAGPVSPIEGRPVSIKEPTPPTAGEGGATIEDTRLRDGLEMDAMGCERTFIPKQRPRLSPIPAEKLMSDGGVGSEPAKTFTFSPSPLHQALGLAGTWVPVSSPPQDFGIGEKMDEPVGSATCPICNGEGGIISKKGNWLICGACCGKKMLPILNPLPPHLAPPIDFTDICPKCHNSCAVLATWPEQAHTDDRWCAMFYLHARIRFPQVVRELQKLHAAVTKAGFGILQASGEWSIHDVSEEGKRSDEESLAVATRNVELEVDFQAAQAEVESLKTDRGVWMSAALQSVSGVVRLSGDEGRDTKEIGQAITVPPEEIGDFVCDRFTEMELQLAAAQQRIGDLESALKRIRQWDHLDTAGDGGYWKRMIDVALTRETETP